MVEGFGEWRLLSVEAAAAEREGGDLVGLPVDEEFHDGKLDSCGDELDFLTYSALDSDA